MCERNQIKKNDQEAAKPEKHEKKLTASQSPSTRGYTKVTAVDRGEPEANRKTTPPAGTEIVLTCPSFGECQWLFVQLSRTRSYLRASPLWVVCLPSAISA
jgi:hypothetical protein